jgi:small subunit ribosomal protein S3
VGQKTHPVGFRLGVIRTWGSRWFAGKDYADWLLEDQRTRRYIRRRLRNAGIAKIDIARVQAPKKISIDIHAARPGMVIGRKGSEVDKLRDELHHLTGKEIQLNIIEVKKPEKNAQLVAEHIALQLEQRVSFRRAMKKTISSAMRMGVQGIKVTCKGRLGGSEMARIEKYHEGRVPLHTLRADIDYATATSHTTFGTIGVKVWIYHGEVFPSDFRRQMAGEPEEVSADARA